MVTCSIHVACFLRTHSSEVERSIAASFLHFTQFSTRRTAQSGKARHEWVLLFQEIRTNWMFYYLE